MLTTRQPQTMSESIEARLRLSVCAIRIEMALDRACAPEPTVTIDHGASKEWIWLGSGHSWEDAVVVDADGESGRIRVAQSVLSWREFAEADHGGVGAAIAALDFGQESA